MLAEVGQKIDLRNLDKSDWKSYRFDEIAHNISERIDPNNTDLEVYIGLEHIDSESIHIKRFGTRDDVNGQKLRFYPGDIIFGRRRAYQRKAGIAETDGFCSAHALVLRANPEVIDPNLFPFFMHSDAFMHRAVDISVGSLSPTINWGTLKKQEFLLPPKAQQAKLAELLWSMDDVLEKEVIVLKEITALRASVEKQYFLEDELKPSIPSKEFFDSVRDGTHDTPRKQADGFRLLTSKNIVNNQLSLETDYFISIEDYEVVNKRSKVERNDILFGMIGTVGQVCRVLEEPNYAIKNMGLFKVRDEYKSRLAFHFFRSSFFQSSLQRTLSGTTQKYVSLGQLRQIRLPNPNSLMVKDWMMKEEHFDLLQSDCLKAISSSKSLQKTLINQVS